MSECEGCGALLTWVQEAYRCENECTWCPECAESCAHVCPNCSGELAVVRRARALP